MGGSNWAEKRWDIQRQAAKTLRVLHILNGDKRSRSLLQSE
jgi:hypothetical protein